MSVIAVVFHSTFWLIALLALSLTIRGVMKGPVYLGLAFEGIERRYFRGKRGSVLAFRATLPALLIVFTWAGYSVVYGLFWPLSEYGYIDRELGEWTSYRSLGGIIGAMMGVGFTQSLSNLYREALIAYAEKDELSTIDVLREFNL